LGLLILTDYHRGSYEIIGKLFQDTLEKIGEIEQLSTTADPDERTNLSQMAFGGVVFHNTLGSSFIPIDGCYNIALPFHEWSEYPKNWIKLLNKFDEVWTTTDHILNVLKRGGLISPVFRIPPALDSESIPEKQNWNLSEKPKFFFVGEPHFRKGHHLLIQGFMKAFPEKGEALLTIKTSPSCEWESPRNDIILIKEKWPREKLLAEYANHDCFVSASLAEGLGLPIAEAIMAKLPVCTNYWGGHTSLLRRGNFTEINHEEIIQPYTSDPAFYAENQKCAYSSPTSVAKALQQFLITSHSLKEQMVDKAKGDFLKNYGSESTSIKIKQRLEEINSLLK
jgi:glycosyltransferase involved in cell wall biosynthesis